MRILYVEDNLADVILAREALKESYPHPFSLQVVHDGAMALDTIDSFSETHYPDLILLDLNIPKCKGLEVLQSIREKPYLKQVPVIVFSTSEDMQDMAESYRSGANCYVTKPIDFDKYCFTLVRILTFWQVKTRSRTQASTLAPFSIHAA